MAGFFLRGISDVSNEEAGLCHIPNDLRMGVKSPFSSFYLQARAKRRLDHFIDHFICRGEFDSYLFRLGYELFQP